MVVPPGYLIQWGPPKGRPLTPTHGALCSAVTSLWEQMTGRHVFKLME